MTNNISKVHTSKEIIKQITSEQLDDVIAKDEYTIIDIRPPFGIEREGRIPGAINIPFDAVIKQIDERKSSPQSLLNGEGPFLFCCTGGVMSYMAAINAQEHGVKRVYNLEGGHSAWKKWKEMQGEVN